MFLGNQISNSRTWVKKNIWHITFLRGYIEDKGLSSYKNLMINSMVHSDLRASQISKSFIHILDYVLFQRHSQKGMVMLYALKFLQHRFSILGARFK